MNYLLVAATVGEITPFLVHYQSQPEKFRVNVDVLITGIGLTATTYQLSRYLAHRRPDMVVQAGVGGCFDEKFLLGTTVIVSGDQIADEGVWEKNKWNSLFDLELLDGNKPPYQHGLLPNPGHPVYRRQTLQKVTAISVNQVSTAEPVIRAYRKKYQPVVESMEGAAMHYVCLQEKIPFLQLRSLSNYVGERNKKKWKLEESVRNLNNELIRLFETI